MGLAFVALPVSSAAATTYSGIQIGPLTVGSGFKATITANQCNVKNAGTYLTAVKTGSGYTLTHGYSAPKVRTTCTTAAKFGSGKMTVRWGKLTVRMKFSRAGRVRAIRVKGCKGDFGHYRHVTGKGTLKMSIHPGAFGNLNLHKVKAEILIYNGTGATSCGGNGSSTDLYANFAKGKRYADGYTIGSRHFADVGGPDNVSRKVKGYLNDSFQAKNIFTFSSDLSKAKISGFNPFLTGSLSYKASAKCVAGHTSGTLKGKLVLHDPVSGTFDYVGKDAYLGYGPPSLQRSSGAC